MRLGFWFAAAMLFLPVEAFAQDGACPAPNMPLRPIIATHTQPPYPEMSVMTKEEGTTLLEVAIGADGVPTDTKVVTSSGSIRLDQAAQDFVKANWRWTAPTQNCKPMAVSTRISIAWSLHNASEASVNAQLAPPTVVMDIKDFPPEALARHEQGTVMVTIYVLTTGRIALARVAQSSGFPDLDDKCVALAKTWRWGTASLDGHPVNTSLLALCQWKPQ